MLIFNQIDLQCPVGLIATKGNVRFGVISTQITNQVQCLNSEVKDFVTANTAKFTDTKPYTNCSLGMDTDYLTEYINTECDNKTSCSVKLPFDKLYTKTYIDLFNPSVIIGEEDFDSGHCGNYASFFIQYPCLIPEHFKDTRQMYGLLIGCITVFIYLYMLVYLDYVNCV
jgi:hypothetical protein